MDRDRRELHRSQEFFLGAYRATQMRRHSRSSTKSRLATIQGRLRKTVGKQMANETRLSILARVQETTFGDSWSEFSAMYDDLIKGWLYRRGVQAQDADDIRQEVMTVVLRRIGSFEHNGRTGAFRAWLRMITSKLPSRPLEEEQAPRIGWT